MTSCFKRIVETIESSNVTSDNLKSALASFQSLLLNRFPTIFVQSRINEVGTEETFNPMMVESDGDEGPVVVSGDDIAASLARSSHLMGGPTLDQEIQRKFPLLVAAVQPHEDILMTCARALSDATDVSLVREAAGYLQDVEQRK